MKPLNQKWRPLTARRPLAAAFVLPLFFLAVLLLTSTGVVEGFPFTKSSGVVELTPASFNRFVSSHKPVYVLFYAPWCGHCRKIHPEWEKFAQAVQGTIRVGAVNADEHSQLGHQFGVRGFPTIKYWNLGEKNISKAQEYGGPRQAGAIQSSAMSQISSAGIKTIKSGDALRKAVHMAPEKKVVVLFSSKQRVPAIFSVLSLSPRLKSMPFYFIGGQVKNELAAEFGVQALPSIAVLNATGGNISTVVYTGKQIAYEPIAKFLSEFATDVADKSAAASEKDTDGAEVKDSGKDKNSATATAGAGGSSQGRPALPVRPVRLTTELLADFCLPKTLRTNGQAPLCVVSLTSAFTLDRVHDTFRNEPLIFFEGHADRDVLIAALRGDLGLPEVADSVNGAAVHQVLLLRAAKRDVIRYKLLDGIETVDGVNDFLQKVLTGELRLGKKVLR
ncbi:thioredoxin [Trypanosoma conorhini]|uniref:Thioredoxin n=1 Tax=Trypanosoma conorhini TaxID=83891 RepID=A0A422PRY6_9TRYP|nr:thioredoxin [Trypanosoma conorhini]RNF20506.1 thioredoxin [Trypanosoma conorhini]